MVGEGLYDPIMMHMKPTSRGRGWFHQVFVVWLCGAASVAAQSLPNGVAAGDVDSTSAVIWARSTALGELVLEYHAEPADGEVNRIEGEVADATIPVKFEIGELTPGTAYTYTITNSDNESAGGTFRTAHETGLHGLRFGVTGDWRGELAPFPAVRNVAERKLDFFVALGDTIYADIASIDFPHPQAYTAAEFRLKHNEVYRQRFGLNYLADVRASTAVFAMIDDHEIANDFAGGAPAGSDSRFDTTGQYINDSQFFADGVQVFQEYNPVRDEFYGATGDARTAGKRKLYRYRTFGSDAALLMLDARSFRDEGLTPIFNPFARRIANEFMEDSFDPSRTMLGQAQLNEFLADLQSAQDAGITWKFVMVPEPIQNLGPALASDRFEGYNHERSIILRYIEENTITNVVFVAADIHSTFVNNLTYQRSADDRQRPIQSFEISTGAVAYAAPFGPTIFDYAPLGIFARVVSNFYNRLTMQRQDMLISRLANRQLRMYGYSLIGLEGSSIHATLKKGKYLAVNTFGWTEFEIDSQTQDLTVTTYGIDWYDQDEIVSNPDRIVAREPEIVSQFRVSPSNAGVETFDHTLPRRHSPCGALGSAGLLWPTGILMACHLRDRRFGLKSRAA